MDKAKLTKLLAMTTSDNDGEALNAIRMANAIVKGAGKTWEEVLAVAPSMRVTISREPYVDPDPWVAPHLKDKPIIDMMFRIVYSQPRSDNEEFWQFMDSIHNRWTKYGNLTANQYNALRKCYSRVRPTASA